MSLIEKILKSRNTALQMLKDRGHYIDNVNTYQQKEIESIFNSLKVKNNKWEKDDNKTQINKALKKVESKQ